MIDQPAPARGRETVTGPFRREFLDEGHLRDMVGIERYGTELETHNGRDAGIDAWQEWYDLGKYLKQLRMEHADALRILEAVYAWALDVNVLDDDIKTDSSFHPLYVAMAQALSEYARTRRQPAETAP